MKVSKTLLQAIVVAVTVGTTVSCTKSVDGKPKTTNNKTKTDSTYVIPDNCPACGMG